MDEEQVAGEVKIFAGEFAGGEFQLDGVVCDDAGLNGLVRARLPDHNRFRPRNLDRERLDRRIFRFRSRRKSPNTSAR
jgi:hypothetical protein